MSITYFKQYLTVRYRSKSDHHSTRYLGDTSAPRIGLCFPCVYAAHDDTVKRKQFFNYRHRLEAAVRFLSGDVNTSSICQIFNIFLNIGKEGG